ncbi:hypothetical protein M9980_09250 [Sphingomonas donggukensis]|uniref:Type 1 fimbrial protein n=1 Tax=Sphingomonas donggukensis TaxID=2949093 RepID=A0ABY4TQU7_9SPHN|nr:hypothetical protein [Sphingomonas donggukensis]URW74760.1 hypothetical protein M9980_09250 [Sphingomonas donggukensis]
MRYLIPSLLLPAMIAASPAAAADVVFTGALVNSCVLNVGTPGVLGPSSDGQTLSSETGTGVAAVLAVVAVGSAPTLSFSAPSLTTPAGFSGTATTAIRYQALSGHTQAYTSGASSMSGGALLDTITVNSRVQSASGFASGLYTVRTVVTCQQ